MRSNEFLGEGPITALGKTLSSLSKIKNTIGKFGSGTKMYLSYKMWAKSPLEISDLSNVQEYSLQLGVPKDVVQQSAKDWAKKFSISQDDIAKSFNSAKRKVKSPLSEKQIAEYFKILYTNIKARIEKSVDTEEMGDTFDSDLENILEKSKELGVKNPSTVANAARSKTFNELSTNNLTLKKLAAIGYIALRY